MSDLDYILESMRRILVAGLGSLLVAASIGAAVLGSADAKESSMRENEKKQAELREKLTPEQYKVTQECGTEPPFRNAYWDNHVPGLYVDVVSGSPLFSSKDKFDSGSGWPSFTRPLVPAAIEERVDSTHGMQRTEVRSKTSHLGHLFNDGPAPAGTRYCVNSASLRFVPAERLAAEGYGDFVSLFPETKQVDAPKPADVKVAPSTETAILAGGCFWGMEELLRKIPGVVETEVGYTGGTTASPSYDQVRTGKTGHAESVRVVFDPTKLRYEELLGWFFRMHDPTTPNRQGNDVGTQYRSVIFTTTDEQAKIARRVAEELDRSGKWDGKVTTAIEPATPFTPAESYHQDYLVKNPGGYTCHYLRD